MIDDPGGLAMRMVTCHHTGEEGEATNPDTSRGYTATLCTISEQSWQQQLSTFITVLLQTGCRKNILFLARRNVVAPIFRNIYANKR